VTVRAGQYKTNLWREQNISETRMAALDRSVVDQVFSQSRSQGVGVGWSNENFRVQGDLTDGIATLNTQFDSAVEADYAITGRFDWNIKGSDWKRFDQHASWRGNEFGAMIGGAIHYQGDGNTNPSSATTPSADVFETTIDATCQGNGWNALAGFVWRNTDSSLGTSFDDMGFLVQGGIFVSDQWELFGRYDVVIPDDSRVNSDNFNTITAGVNYFFFPQSFASRITAEVIWYLNAQADSSSIVSPNPAQNLLASPEDNQFGLGVQWQVQF
jgi:hypothetical protein